MDKTVWRLLEMDVNSYAEATMSLSPAIARACAEGAVPETLAMFTHRKPSIVIGRQKKDRTIQHFIFWPLYLLPNGFDHIADCV